MKQEKKELKEIEKIREKYKDEKIDSETYQKIKDLDKNTVNTAKRVARIFAVLGSILGIIGLCFIFAFEWIFAGILMLIAGLIFISITWPVYTRVISKEREKIRYEILYLCEAYSSDK